MIGFSAQHIAIEVSDGLQVSGLYAKPPRCRVGLVLAHGAGAGMEHPSMTGLATGLYERDVATLRFQFPYMDQGGKRTDSPAVCHATVRAAVRRAGELMVDIPICAGGRSFGGRMTSQAQALNPLPSVRGLVFFGFPLHPAKKTSDSRAAHLRSVKIPMLFLQGSRDDLADLGQLQPVIDNLQPLASLKIIEHADHSFAVLRRSGRTASEVREEVLDTFVAWAAQTAG